MTTATVSGGISKREGRGGDGEGAKGERERGGEGMIHTFHALCQLSQHHT